MHACSSTTLDQLISLRDGEPVDVEAKRHVDYCAECSLELTRLRGIQSALRSLPMLPPPAYNGAGLRARLRAVRTFRIAGVAAAAGVCAITVLLISAVTGPRSRVDVARIDEPTRLDNTPSIDNLKTIVDSASIDAAVIAEAPGPQMSSLVIRSQELDSRLQRLPRRPQIERAGTSATIDTLQDRIQWVDYQLSLAHDVGMTEGQSAQLWKNRIQLMDSLLKVRYAEAQRSAAVMTQSASYYSPNIVR